MVRLICRRRRRRRSDKSSPRSSTCSATRSSCKNVLRYIYRKRWSMPVDGREARWERFEVADCTRAYDWSGNELPSEGASCWVGRVPCQWKLNPLEAALHLHQTCPEEQLCVNRPRSKPTSGMNSVQKRHRSSIAISSKFSRDF
jgi:hypothetical protein